MRPSADSTVSWYVSLNGKQECIPVGCIPPAHYRTGGLCPVGLPNWDPPGQRPPSWTETPLNRDPPRQRPPWTETPWTQNSLWTETPPKTEAPWTETPRQRPPGHRPPSGQRPSPDRDPPWTETPSYVTCGACWDRDLPLWTEWHSLVKTLPCRNFVAGGKNPV